MLAQFNTTSLRNIYCVYASKDYCLFHIPKSHFPRQNGYSIGTVLLRAQRSGKSTQTQLLYVERCFSSEKTVNVMCIHNTDLLELVMDICQRQQDLLLYTQYIVSKGTVDGGYHSSPTFVDFILIASDERFHLETTLVP